MAKTDFWLDGGWNFFCDLCGAKNKSNDGVLTLNKLWVCRHHKELRNEQDFVRGIEDDTSADWTRTEPADNFVVSEATRRMEELLPVTEDMIKVLFRRLPMDCPPLTTDFGTINGSVLSGYPIGGGPSCVENLALSEFVTVQLSSTLILVDSLTMSEVFTYNSALGAKINGTPLNITTLG